MFKAKYSGINYFGRIYDIKEELKKKFHKEVDIADKNALNKIGKKYILPGGVKYV
jgi:predicted nucleotidyltransferase